MAPKKKTTDETKQSTGAKPGPKTTEFWITLVCLVVGSCVSAWGASKGNEAITAVGGAIAAVPAGLYSVSRGIAKKNSHGA